MGGMDFEYDFDNFPITDGLIDNVRRNQGRITPIDENNGSAYLGVDELRNNAYGLYGQYQNFGNTLDLSTWAFMEAGRFTNDNDTPARVSLYKEDRYIGKATLDWQADRYNRIKLGGEFTQYEHRPVQLPPDRQVLLRRVQGEADPVERLRRRPARPGRRGRGRRSPLRLLRHQGLAALRHRPGRLAVRLPPDLDQPRVRSQQPDLGAGAGREPLVPEPARPGVVPGHRPHQLPAELLASGAGAGLRPGAGRDQHRPRLHQHQPGLRLRSRLRQDHRLRVRHPARVQRRHGAGHRGLQQGHRVRSGRPPGLALRPHGQPDQRLPHPDEPRLRQRPRASTSVSTGGSATTSTARSATRTSRPRTPAPIRSPTSTTARGS